MSGLAQWGRRFLRTARFGLVGTVACLMSIWISYSLVRHWTRGATIVTPLTPETLRVARQFREASNRLAALANEYTFRFPKAAIAPEKEGQAWMQNHFRPESMALQKILSGDHQWGLPGRDPAARKVHETLTAAADRVAAAASRPNDAALAKRALLDIRAAVRAAEAWIARSGANPRLDTPAVSFSAGMAAL